MGFISNIWQSKSFFTRDLFLSLLSINCLEGVADPKETDSKKGADFLQKKMIRTTYFFRTGSKNGILDLRSK